MQAWIGPLLPLSTSPLLLSSDALSRHLCRKCPFCRLCSPSSCSSFKTQLSFHPVSLCPPWHPASGAAGCKAHTCPRAPRIRYDWLTTCCSSCSGLGARWGGGQGLSFMLESTVHIIGCKRLCDEQTWCEYCEEPQFSRCWFVFVCGYGHPGLHGENDIDAFKKHHSVIP